MLRRQRAGPRARSRAVWLALAALAALAAAAVPAALFSFATPPSGTAASGAAASTGAFGRRLSQLHRHRQQGSVAAAASAAAPPAAEGEEDAVAAPIPEELQFHRKYISDTVRNTAIIVSMAGIVAGSWVFTGKWWKLPLIFALPSMAYRLYTTRGDTTKLAEVSASVDMKYVASSEKEQKELHSFMCSGCGYTLFPARNREAAFFTDKFKCPMCGSPKSAFFDMSEDDEEEEASEASAPEAAPPAAPSSS